MKDLERWEEASLSHREALALKGDDSVSLFSVLKAERTLCDWHDNTILDRVLRGCDKALYPFNNRATEHASASSSSSSSSFRDDEKDLGCGLLPYDASLLPVSPAWLLSVASFRSNANENRVSFIDRSKCGTVENSVDGVRGVNGVNGVNGDYRVGTGKDRLRVAYVSYDLNNHPMGHLTVGLMERHRRDHIEVLALSYGIDDKSVMRERLTRAPDKVSAGEGGGKERQRKRGR